MVSGPSGRSALRCFCLLVARSYGSVGALGTAAGPFGTAVAWRSSAHACQLLEAGRAESALGAAARHAGTAVVRRSAAHACQLLGAGDAGRGLGLRTAMEPGKVGARGRRAGPVWGSSVGPERTAVGVPTPSRRGRVGSRAGRSRSGPREAGGRVRASRSAGPRRGRVSAEGPCGRAGAAPSAPSGPR